MPSRSSIERIGKSVRVLSDVTQSTTSSRRSGGTQRPVMGPHAFFHVEILFRDFGDDAVLLGNRGFELGDARAIGLGRLRLAALRASILQRGGQVLQRLPLPQVQQAGRNLVLVTQVRDRDLIAEMPTQDCGLLLRREDPTRALDSFL
ncbi:MAG: hypothetical protein HEQ38_10180 [Gemmatimonas sp.]|nr:hypothetical protein [Gemmatimonas sp.]